MTSLPISKDPRPLGRSELNAFPIAYGCWRFAGTDLAEATAKIATALELGINLFDTADIYGFDGQGGFGDAETLLGQVFAQSPALRDKMILASKCGVEPGVPYNSSAAYITSACDASLKRLQVDVIDLYQVHRPDMLAHPQEVASALSKLHQAGKIRAIGVSNYTAAQFAALQAYLDIPIATHQPEFSPRCLTPLFDGVFDQCLQHNVTPLAWSPLAGGLLAKASATTRQEADDEAIAGLVACLERLAQNRGCSTTAVALAFVLAHPSGPIPIVGTQRIERIKDSVSALSVALTRSEWYDIVEASMNKPLP